MNRIDWNFLRSQLAAHTSADEKEARDVHFVLDFLDAHADDAHLRAQVEGHLTGSGFVLDAARAHVLLLHHGRLNRWLQPGGHGEGELEPRLIALREIQEETGLCGADLAPYPDQRILDVDVHEIPARPGEPKHFHLDLRYGFVAREGAEPRLSDESRALRWVPLDDLPADADPSLHRAIKKLRPRGQPPAR